MRVITPRERLKVNTVADAELVKRLPSVVIIQRTGDSKEEERTYLVENERWKEYARISGSDYFTPTRMKEEAAKKLGYRIEMEAFEDSTACQLSCMHFNDGSAYSIYAVKFKDMPRKIISVD
jgi:hypothetical protein